MSEKVLSAPVLFLVFNRLETTKKVFAEIKKARPSRIYVASDGARPDRSGEAEIVESVRDFIVKSIDWPCELFTLFRPANLGCRMAVSSAITWFFSREPHGIILEDDCLPDQSFFTFCQDLLEKYKDDRRIWHISGDNFQDGIRRGDADYYFSQYAHVWGWASWADRWNFYDVDMNGFQKFVQFNGMADVFPGSKKVQKYWLNILKKVFDKEIDTWDYQWNFTLFANRGMAIVPNQNLVANIGFGGDATHTSSEKSDSANLQRVPLALPLKHPEFFCINSDGDNYTNINHFYIDRSIVKRLFKKISPLISGRKC